MKISNEQFETKKAEKPKKQLPQFDKKQMIGIGVIVLVIFIILAMFFRKPAVQNDSHEGIKVEKRVKKAKKKVTKPIVTQSSTQSSAPVAESAISDASNNIKGFFNAYAVYDDKTSTPKQRAEKMLAFATKDAVDKFTNNVLKTDVKPSVATVSSMNKPIEIEKDKTKQYHVVVYNELKDSRGGLKTATTYLVESDNQGKISGIKTLSVVSQ